MDPKHIPLTEWQTEEKTLPNLELDDQGNPRVSQRTVKQRNFHTPLIPHTICAQGEHYFQFVAGGRPQDVRVLVKCRRRPVGQQFVPGQHHLADGQLTPFRHSNSTADERR